eukprot:GILJ01005782.1.p1 GENE.GILJ01005782.1~~GILJ01005782.1.p1  ORF type:complete len:332 (+),score=33.36 GILJ01005782.1:59-1054(+)
MSCSFSSALKPPFFAEISEGYSVIDPSQRRPSEHLRDYFVKENERRKHFNHLLSRSSSDLRIATYNVHFWKNTNGNFNLHGILKTIQEIDADIIALQEVLFNQEISQEKVEEQMKRLGYHHHAFCRAAAFGSGAFGNSLFSRLEMVNKYSCILPDGAANDTRCVVAADFRVNGEMLTVANVHFDVWDESGATRALQAGAMIEFLQESGSRTGNVIALGDWNTVREADYVDEQASMYRPQLEEKHRARTSMELVWNEVTALFERAGYIDCFDKERRTPPWYSVWAGTRVDYIYLSQALCFDVIRSSIFHSAASDHIPVLVDLTPTQRDASAA